VLDALSLAAEAADEVLLGTVRDTHRAIAKRVHGLVRLGVGPAVTPVETVHTAIAGAVYGGIGLSLRGASKGLDKAAATGIGPRLEDDRRGRFLNAAVNGLIGDELLRDRPQMAIPMAVRHEGRDVDLWDRAAVARAFPAATGRLVVFLHGLCEDEGAWRIHRDRVGSTYAEALATQGWTPVFLRTSTGLPIRENGVALASTLQRLVDQWPVEVERIALVGHSMGGLIMRASSVVMTADRAPAAWTRHVSDVVTLGSPHRGAPLAAIAGHGSRALGWLEETAAFGRILERRSEGIRDLVDGLNEDAPPLGHARYRLVSATVTTTGHNPVGGLLGDGLVRPLSASGRDRRGRELFPDATVLRVGRAHHFSLLNHPEVHAALRDWLS
jgi:pimeloyl-ACP methyl ester carboxylesterase